MNKMNSNNISFLNINDYNKRDILYYNILISLLLYNRLKINSLLLLNEKENAVYKSIKKGIEREHIKEQIIEYKFPSKRKKVDKVYYITNTGIQFLKDNAEIFHNTKMEWLQGLPRNCKRINLSYEKGSTVEIPTFQKSCAISLFLEMSGIKTQPLILSGYKNNCDDEYQSETLEKNGNDNLYQIIKSAKAECDFEKLLTDNSESEENKNYFTEKAELTALTKLYLKEDKTKEDLQSIRLSGILETPTAPFVIYGDSKKGLSFNSWVVGKEIEIYHIYMSHYKKYNYPHKDYGILLVNTPKSFVDIYTGKGKGKEKKTDNPAPMGNRYEKFYVFPNTRKGIENFKEFLALDTIEYKKNKIAELVASGKYEEYTGTKERADFPLINSSGERLYLGTVIEPKRLQFVKKSANDEMHEPFKILCYSFQEEYYKRILPNVELEFLDEEEMNKKQENKKDRIKNQNREEEEQTQSPKEKQTEEESPNGLVLTEEQARELFGDNIYDNDIWGEEEEIF